MRRVERRRFATVRVGAGLAALVAWAALAGCTPTGSSFDLVTSSYAVTTSTDPNLPTGPAKATVLPGDLVLRNDIFTAVVAGAWRLGVPQLAATSGALLDLSLNDGSDQLGLFTQSVLGLRVDATVSTTDPTPTSPGDTPIVWIKVSAVEFHSGPFDGAFGIQCTGRLLDMRQLGAATTTFIGAGVTTTSPVLPGFPVVTTSNGVDLEVVTTYLARQGDPYLTIDTLVSHTDPSTTTSINIFSIVDLWPNADPLGSGTTLTTWNPTTGLSTDLVAGGSTKIVAPFVGQFGNALSTATSPASYTHFDDVLGQELHIFDPIKSTSLSAELNAASTVIKLTAPAHWVRKIALGGRNDVASSSDVAIQALGDSAALRGLGPNSIGRVARIHGTVKNASLVPGTVMNFIEFTPAKFFNPNELAGFVDAPVPDPVLKLSGLTVNVWTFAQVDPATGAYSALVPVDFDARVPVVSPGPGRGFFPGAATSLGVARQYYVAPKLPTAAKVTDPPMFPAFAGDTVDFEVKDAP